MTPRGARAVLLAVALVASVVAPFGVATPASGQPSGFVTVADANVHEDLPVGTDVGVTRSDLKGSTMVSEYASTTEITLTTPDRAEGYVNGTSVTGGGEIALVISDDTNHEGREVALPADAIRASLGRLPEAVHGTHEDGSEWTRQVRAESGLLIFEVPHFSSNTVTFAGEVNVSGTFSDGSRTSYELTDLDAASDPEVTLTGELATENDTESASVSDGGTLPLSVAGTTEPSDATVTVSAPASSDGNPADRIDEAGEEVPLAGDSSDDKRYVREVRFQPDNSGKLSQLDVMIPSYEGSNYGITVDVYLVQQIPDARGDSDTGTLIADGWNPEYATGRQTIPLDTWATVEAGKNYTVEFHTTTTDIDGTADRVMISGEIGSSGYWTTLGHGDGGSISGTHMDMGYTVGADATDVTVTGDSSVSFGDIPAGSSQTETVPISGSTSGLGATFGGAGSVTVEATYEERAETQNPTVSLNGEQIGSFSGTLADGSTASHTANSSLLQAGENNVSVSLGSTSADAPDPVVDLSFTHQASDGLSAEYATEGWTERYNVSKSFASTQENAELTVPFVGNVHRLVRLEERTNDGTWSDVPTDRYSLGSDGTLTVALDEGDSDGDVDAGTDYAVRTTARRVEVLNGSITVTDPILPGEDADVEFRVDSRSPGFAVDLRKLPTEGVRYTYAESWSDPESRMVVTADGARRLEVPAAEAGDTARVTRVPVDVSPETGEATVAVADPDEPTISLGPGGSSGDDVTVRYLEASTGTSYELYSTSRERVVATSTADAGVVTFVEDDSTESLRIQSNATGGGGGMFADPSANAPAYGVDRPLLLVGGLGALVLLLVWATGRSGLAGASRWGVVGGVAGAAGLIAFEALNPGSVSTALSEGLASVTPLAGIAGVVIVGYTVVSWWRTRQKKAGTPETSVSFNLRGRNK